MKINVSLTVSTLVITVLTLCGCGLQKPPITKQEISHTGDTKLSSVEAEDTTKSLTIWWEQGYTPGANEAIRSLVQAWEKQSGIKTTLELRPGRMNAQAKNAIERGNPPNIVGPIYIPLIDRTWESQLTDVADAIAPLQDKFSSIALSTVRSRDRGTDSHTFYGVPIGFSTYYLHYWRPYLDRLGLQQSDIPEDWHEFWQFWEDVGDRIPQSGNKKLNTFCLALSREASDAFAVWLFFLQGHNVEIVDETGNFILDLPANRQGLINTLSQLSRLYQKGLIPADAVGWKAPENNTRFLNHECLLTLNVTLSIPLTQKLPLTPYTQQELHRYESEIVTLDKLPKTANGTPSKVSVSSFMVIIPSNAANREAAKQFLTYLFQPENLQQWTEQVSGRYFPVMPEILETPFWQKTQQDPHLFAAQTIMQNNAYPSDPIYGEIREAEILIDALMATIEGTLSTEDAADRAIARIQEIVEPQEQ
ncbi:ABC transporter substrate-binding protein [Roseofilum casamattae]|uniref:ABC transporter substrate-binding protein n=1 Tax=Roseofilum casamattae BLCC-M143 TaxID=3022442 RepID=A0ABT7BWD6_9CYAN|nr:ABC transporter substrate-binding protein [Roseofilum casamattae]MDJ1183498.1 ABC transporter substrate-binding protein [Roseofilum casamattae BLCC-M143]